MANWLTDILAHKPGSECELVERYTHRLLAFARRQLPDRVRRRVDPEDVVQSVYRSFFRRLNDGRFSLEDSQDVWRLLAAMTFHKARNAVAFHQRECRDVRREQPLDAANKNESADSALFEFPQSEEIEWLFEALELLLSTLNEHQREIVVRRLEGESIADIAQWVKRSRRTVLRVLAHVQELAAQQLEATV